MPFPRRGVAAPLVAAAAAAQLVAFPAGAVASEYAGTGAPGLVTAGLAGLACGAAGRSAARAAGKALAPRTGVPAHRVSGWVLGLLVAGYAVLAVALGFRLVPGGAGALPADGSGPAAYAVAVVAAVGWAVTGRRG